MENMNTKVLTILTSAYDELSCLEEWCKVMVTSCSKAAVAVVSDTDSDRYKRFLKTTLVGTASDVNWSGARVCLTNTLSQHELLIQAIERIHRREGSGKNLLTLGCSDMSSNPSAQVCVSRSFESVIPNQSINILLQRQWRTLLTRIGDDLMLHLLSSRSVFTSLNPSCYLQLTGIPLYDLWPYLRNIKITFPTKTKSRCLERNTFKKMLKKKHLKKAKLKQRFVQKAESMTANESPESETPKNRKRKRASQVSTCSSSASRGVSVKRARLSSDVMTTPSSPWRRGEDEDEVTRWSCEQRESLNEAFCEEGEMGRDRGEGDELTTEVHQTEFPDIVDHSLYTTAVEFPSYLLDESIKIDPNEKVLGSLQGGGIYRTEDTDIKRKMGNVITGRDCVENKVSHEMLDPVNYTGNKVKKHRSSNEMGFDTDFENSNCSIEIDFGKVTQNMAMDCTNSNKSKVTKVKDMEINTIQASIVDDGLEDKNCPPGKVPEKFVCVKMDDSENIVVEEKSEGHNVNRKEGYRQLRTKKRKKNLKEENVNNNNKQQEKGNHPVHSRTPIDPGGFRPYMYHTFFHRSRLMYSKSLKETFPKSSLLIKTCDLESLVKEVVSEVMKVKVMGSANDEENVKRLKCRETVEGKLGEIMRQLLLKHRTICYKKTLAQFIPFPESSTKVKDSAPRPSQTEGAGPEGLSIATEGSDLQTSPKADHKGHHKGHHTDYSIQDLLGQYTPPRKVFLLLRRLLKGVLPRQLLGSKKNEEILLRGIEKLTSLGKFEKFCLGEVTSKIKIKHIKWLPRKLPHVAKEFLVAKVVFWLIDRYVFVILRGFFYITDSTMYRNRLFYYRKAVWAGVRRRALLRYTTSGMLEEIPPAEAQAALTSGQALGFAQLRLLPKRASVRPIVNLGRRAQSGPNKGLSINGQLQNLLQVLTFVKKEHPDLMGCSQFGASDIYKTWKDFVLNRREKGDTRPLYFVKVDIENCYDSIDQKKLFEIVNHNLKQENVCEEYIIRRFATLHIANNQLKRIFRRDVTSLDRFEPDFSRYLREMCGLRDLSGVVFVDQVLHMHETNEHLLERLAKHLFNNIIQIGSKFYRQKVGISQGSILSTMLCNSYYGNMEAGYLRLHGDEVLMRQVDDFLLVTPHVEHAVDFLRLMRAGIPEYNCVLSPSKTLVNFDLDSTSLNDDYVKQLPCDALFPWCGMLINPTTLEVLTDYTRCHGLKITDIMTFDMTQKIGQTIQAKLLRGLTSRNWLLCLDGDIMSDETLALSLFKLFYMSAIKLHAFMQKLPPKQGVQENPGCFIDIILSLPGYLYNNIRCKLKTSSQRKSQVTTHNALHWLCLQAAHAKLSLHTPKYGKRFLKQLKKLQKQHERKLSSAMVEDFVNISRYPPQELSAECLY